MKRPVLVFPLVLLFLGSVVPAAAKASDEQVMEVPNAAVQIAGAVAAAPPDMRDGARVLAYDAKGELVLARKGTNHLTCLADDPSKEGFHSACYQDGLEAYMARGRELRKQGIDGPDNLDRRHDEIKAGKLDIPRTPCAVYTLGGADAKQDPTTGEVTGGKMLYAIYIPFATEESTGLSTTPEMKGAPWIMRPGTPTAHIMVYPPQPDEPSK
jgi:hypothetical protein